VLTLVFVVQANDSTGQHCDGFIEAKVSFSLVGGYLQGSDARMVLAEADERCLTSDDDGWSVHSSRAFIDNATRSFHASFARAHS
jgi:hypothetical protein